MFKFGFNLEEEDTEELNLPGPSVQPISEPTLSSKSTSLPCHHVTLDELMDSLPDTISYSPIEVPGLQNPMLRRDLYDARFQLTQRDNLGESSGTIDQSTEVSEQGEEAGEAYVDSQTDLVPGLYEGGLKTWEGGVDLVDVLSGIGHKGGIGRWACGARVLEIGCGTALPSAFILQSLLSTADVDRASSTPTTLHLQDFNRPVLSLVTLPNLILAALPFIAPEALEEDPTKAEVEDIWPDLDKAGTLNITPMVRYAFKTLLAERGIQIKFTYGHWSGLAQELTEKSQAYDIVLTAETIYQEDSVDDLLDVLRRAYRNREGSQTVSLEDSLGHLKLQRWAETPVVEGTGTVMLVAAKVLYFGVGGGSQAFLGRVRQGGGWSEKVKEWTLGVGRQVIRIGW